MYKSERLERYNEDPEEEADKVFAKRILDLLNHPDVDKYCMVDAYYYDYSTIPDEILNSLNLYRDAYLIYGITNKGEIVSKWVERYDLDSNDPIVDGKVIPSEKNATNRPPFIKQSFNSKLLSTPIPEMIKRML